jgi:hypothetical protein
MPMTDLIQKTTHPICVASKLSINKICIIINYIYIFYNDYIYKVKNDFVFLLLSKLLHIVFIKIASQHTLKDILKLEFSSLSLFLSEEIVKI